MTNIKIKIFFIVSNYNRRSSDHQLRFITLGQVKHGSFAFNVSPAFSQFSGPVATILKSGPSGDHFATTDSLYKAKKNFFIGPTVKLE
ncbi:MAG: hypothetical protein ACOYL6_12770 [Bacteriovoracaceae bacterium]